MGLAIHNIRARDSYIRGSNGSSNGIVPMLRVYNNSGTHVAFPARFHASSLSIGEEFECVGSSWTYFMMCENAAARYVDQGGGKRKGSIAVYLEPWHADIFEFLELRKVCSGFLRSENSTKATHTKRPVPLFGVVRRSQR